MRIVKVRDEEGLVGWAIQREDRPQEGDTLLHAWEGRIFDTPAEAQRVAADTGLV